MFKLKYGKVNFRFLFNIREANKNAYNYTDKIKFDEFVLKKKNTNSSHINAESMSESETIINKKLSANHRKLESKRINLLKVFHKDLLYFKVDRNFEINDLRKKYLQLAKLYHPDTKQETNSNFEFNKLQNSYDRLKIFYDLRIELDNIAKELTTENDVSLQLEEMKFKLDDKEDPLESSDDININYSYSNINTNEIDNMTKDQYIKHLCTYYLIKQ